MDQRSTGKSNPLHCDLPGSDSDLQATYAASSHGRAARLRAATGGEGGPDPVHDNHRRGRPRRGAGLARLRAVYHARKAQESIDKIFDDCAAEASCCAAFPGLRADLEAVIARLDQGPAKRMVKAPKTGKPIAIATAKGAFTTTLRSMQYSPLLAARIPLYVHPAALAAATRTGTSASICPSPAPRT